MSFISISITRQMLRIHSHSSRVTVHVRLFFWSPNLTFPLSANGSPTREFTDEIHQIDADSIHVESDEVQC